MDGMRGTGGNGDLRGTKEDGRDDGGPGDGVREREGAETYTETLGVDGTGGCDWARRAFVLALSLSAREDEDATLYRPLLCRDEERLGPTVCREE